MRIFNKILCILAALAIYPASTTIPRSTSSLNNQLINEPVVKLVKQIKIRNIEDESVRTHPVHYESYAEREKQLSCLQKNIYFEAAVESTAGKLAVAHVTWNRVTNSKFPNTFCKVVYEGIHHASGFPKKENIYC